ncbi:4-nitrophenylphosphatase-like [Sitophilus oryzae]|uniref:4-nitrophenylphosphatase-like n=1 Tax=Sitophilus oryzae TaxID=7048 RepID=A0A6J2X3E5_SITOR|nr:4-nitrophenylphosphatase-like [Sitophilus oryzae]XP_030745514.1 4-nitrophenylphosphatase-like [Sitophilus oryzae]XP_030745515.1 4-nitrophenylphosphatase-like [Sitophilus oryzae]XP_030745516.1 4-nitrophenylphosphatase-like [Sitophilus oryzae]
MTDTKEVANLKDASVEEQGEFLKSFDTILCDIDGVIWSTLSSIDGAPDAIKSLRSIGKQVFFVTNNTTIPLEFLVKRLQEFEMKQNEVLRPDLAIIWYLKSINFDKEVYIVGVKALKDTIKKSGFKVHEDEGDQVEETIAGVIKAINKLNPKVGAVIMDADLNVSFVKLQRCVEYIKKNNAIFLVGGWDPVLPFADTFLIGPKYFIQAVEDLSGKKPLTLAKPHDVFHDFVEESIKDLHPERVLFIGDSVLTDMTYAQKFGHKKLLPLTGCTSKEEVTNWKFEENLKPDYYVDSLRDVHIIIQELKKKNVL